MNMKRITGIFALGLALVLSCSKNGPDGINEITDLYTVPTGAVEMAAPTAKSTWAGDRRYFDLSFGSDLVTTLVGYDALLSGGQYVLGDDIIGNAILSKTKIGGAAAQSGFITVNNKAGQYTIVAQIDGKVLAWKGTLPFTPDPDPVALSVVMADTKSNLGDGQNTVTLKLSQEGISSEFDMTTWQTVWKGEGKYISLDLYSADGYLHPGTYTPSAKSGEVKAGEFGIGWDNPDFGDWGMNWGSCLWTVSGGQATAEKILGGTVTVTKEEKVWTITYGGVKYPLEVVFTGEIPALTEPDKPAGPVVPDYLYTETIEAGDGVDKHIVEITDKDANLLAHLELLLAPGETDLSGSYPSTSYASQPGQMCDGYYIDAGDWGIFEGGSYYMKDGAKEYITAGTATVAVTKIATGAYNFACAFFNYNCAGPDYVPEEGGGQGGEGDDDVTGDVVLKLDAGLTYTMEDQTASNTDVDKNPLSGVTLWRVNVLQGGDLVANFDLVVKEGSSDLAGTYTVMSYPNAVGKAGNGWGFAAWNMFGGCYYLVNGKHYFLPNDATLTVSANSDGTLKFKAAGTFQDEDYANVEGGLLLNNVAKQ